MIINDITAEHMVYLQPRRFIESRVLPFSVQCFSCKTSLTIDMMEDLRAHDGGDKWKLATECPMCKSRLILTPNEYPTKPIDVHYAQIVKYYMTLYPKPYTYFHGDTDGGRIGFPTVILGFSGILFGATSLVTHSEGDLAEWAYVLFWLCILGVLWIGWSCLSPVRKKNAVRKTRKLLGLTIRDTTLRLHESGQYTDFD